MVRVYKITDPDLPEELHTVRDVFNGTIKPEPPEEPKNTREPSEGLHDYLTRKGIKCFCKLCRSKNG